MKCFGVYRSVTVCWVKGIVNHKSLLTLINSFNPAARWPYALLKAGCKMMCSVLSLAFSIFPWVYSRCSTFLPQTVDMLRCEMRGNQVLRIDGLIWCTSLFSLKIWPPGQWPYDSGYDAGVIASFLVVPLPSVVIWRVRKVQIGNWSGWWDASNTGLSPRVQVLCGTKR